MSKGIDSLGAELKEHLEKILEQAANHEFELAKERLEKRREEIVAETLIHLRKTFEMNTMADAIEFRVIMKEN